VDVVVCWLVADAAYNSPGFDAEEVSGTAVGFVAAEFGSGSGVRVGAVAGSGAGETSGEAAPAVGPGAVVGGAPVSGPAVGEASGAAVPAVGPGAGVGRGAGDSRRSSESNRFPGADDFFDELDFVLNSSIKFFEVDSREREAESLLEAGLHALGVSASSEGGR